MYELKIPFKVPAPWLIWPVKNVSINSGCSYSFISFLSTLLIDTIADIRKYVPVRYSDVVLISDNGMLIKKAEGMTALTGGKVPCFFSMIGLQ